MILINNEKAAETIVLIIIKTCSTELQGFHINEGSGFINPGKMI